MMGTENEWVEIINGIIGRLVRTYDVCDQGRHNMLTTAEKSRWDKDADDLVEKSQRLSRLCEGFMREIQGLYEIKRLMDVEKKEVKIRIEQVDSHWDKWDKVDKGKEDEACGADSLKQEGHIG
jgi:hypothetical protein